MSSEQINSITENSPSVQAHLQMLQNIILRMASNSSACKSWCITLVSAIVVVVADKGKPEYIWIALLPTCIFGCLDAYYLSLEKGFRASYNDFIEKIHTNNLTRPDLYAITPSGETAQHQLKAIKSTATWGFYIPLIALIFSVKAITGS